MHPCRICRHPIELLLDSVRSPVQPVPGGAVGRGGTHPLRLGQCPACSLLQLIQPVAAATLKPPKPMLYKEPEWHLDQLVDRLAALPGVSRDTRICGLTYKEASTIDRLRRRGYHNAICLDVRRDLGVGHAAAGVETIQEQISAGVLKDLPDAADDTRL